MALQNCSKVKKKLSELDVSLFGKPTKLIYMTDVDVS